MAMNLDHEKLPVANSNMPHGTVCACPSCYSTGRKDDMRRDGNKAEFDDAVWLNSYTGFWECHECWLK